MPRGSPTHSRRTFPVCCGNPPTHPPPTTHLGLFGKFPGCTEVPRVFWEVPGTFGEVPGVFGKFRVYLESSGCFWEVPRVFREVPARFWKFPGVLESCRVLRPKKHVLRSFVRKKFRSKAKLPDFRPMFHAEPAGIRSWSCEPAVIRSRRLELNFWNPSSNSIYIYIRY
jgi:hypothetical protein